MFFSDNGGSGRKPYLAYNTGLNTPLRGDKGQTLEGGIHVPFFVAWPGHLPAGKTYDNPVIALDVLPTACSLADSPVDASVEGVNLLPYLTGANTAAPHPALYWRFGPQRAVRRGPWKLVDWFDFKSRKSSGWQLFNLAEDLGEQHDLAPTRPDLVSELAAEWNEWDKHNAKPLWHGGTTEDPTAPTPARKQP